MTYSTETRSGFDAYQKADYKMALRLWSSQAENGNPEAQYWLGFLYYNGYGVSQDYSKAATWYRRAAEQEYSPAELCLGNLYEKGLGVERDYSVARDWYQRLAERGDAGGQWALGNFFKNGLGVSTDYFLAEKWFQLSAEQGLAPAQCSLGRLYETGPPPLQDKAAAVKWYKLAADQDFLQAQVYLSFMFANGYGVARDFVYAHMWATLAFEKMKPGGAREMEQQNIVDLERNMSSTQITASRHLAGQRRSSKSPTRLPENQSDARSLSRQDATPTGNVAAMINRNIMGTLGFLAGFVLAFLAEAVLVVGFETLDGSRLTPVGLGWIAAPIGAGIAGWRFAQRIEIVDMVNVAFGKVSSGANPRLPVAIYASWALTYLSYVFATKSEFLDWYESNSDKFWIFLLLPPTVGTAVLFLFRWARKAE